MALSTDYSVAADYSIGTILTLCSILGLCGNLLALTYFAQKSSRSANAAYFKHIYMTIALVDLLICLLLFPNIEPAFRTGRAAHLLQDVRYFCEIWGHVWQILPEMSVFMVALLSVSRLLLLMRPTTHFKPVLGWLLPLSYLLATLTIKLCFLLAGKVELVYRTSSMMCKPKTVVREGATGTITTASWNIELVIRTLSSVQNGMTVLPISVSFVLSLVQLRRAKELAVRAGVSSDKQVEAAKTVILITLVYVICNIPTLVYFIYLNTWVFSIDPGSTSERDIGDSYARYFSNNFMQNYMWVVTYNVCIALNSTVNPVVYYCRIESFKQFVRQQHRRVSLAGERTHVTQSEL